jgi:HAE1 family hydrophobic/amphiphilic exporter-1
MGQQIAISVCFITEGSGPSKLERRDKTASVTVQGQNIEFRLELL